MVNYYRINVSLNGKYLFATENGENGGGITRKEDAQRLTELLKEKFPESEGYKVSVVYWQSHGTHMEF